MPQIVECIPNFSEGRSPEIIRALKTTAESIPGAALLDIHTDADHNRSVFTLMGAPDSVAEAAFALAAEAVRCIDLTVHKGEHPRIGAVDVIPFVPIKNIGVADCVTLANGLGKKIAEQLGLPVFLYEHAAARERCRNLADIRRGAFETMQPDYGREPHPTAGAVAIGVRKPLIAFNINLDTSDISAAKAIAKKVRGSSGGLPYCKALGMYMSEKGLAQVSMNLTDYEEMPIYRVFEAVREEAARLGVKIHSSELVGLAPADAFFDCAEYFLKLDGFDKRKHIIENNIPGSY